MTVSAITFTIVIIAAPELLTPETFFIEINIDKKYSGIKEYTSDADFCIT